MPVGQSGPYSARSAVDSRPPLAASRPGHRGRCSRAESARRLPRRRTWRRRSTGRHQDGYQPQPTLVPTPPPTCRALKPCPPCRAERWQTPGGWAGGRPCSARGAAEGFADAQGRRQAVRMSVPRDGTPSGGMRRHGPSPDRRAGHSGGRRAQGRWLSCPPHPCRRPPSRSSAPRQYDRPRALDRAYGPACRVARRQAAEAPGYRPCGIPRYSGTALALQSQASEGRQRVPRPGRFTQRAVPGLTWPRTRWRCRARARRPGSTGVCRARSRQRGRSPSPMTSLGFQWSVPALSDRIRPTPVGRAAS